MCPSRPDPRGGLGNSESGICPGLCSRNLHALGILESGICGGVSWNLPTRKQGIWKLGSLIRGRHRGAFRILETRKLGIWNLQRSILVSGICTLGNMESGFWVPSAVCRTCGPPGLTAGLGLTLHVGYNRGGLCNASGPLAVDLPGDEGPLRTPAYLRGRGVTFLSVGAALRVGLRAPSSRRGAG